MLRFHLFGFPIVIHWLFWATLALVGGGIQAQTPEAMQAVLVFVVAGFLSVLVHELGHAFAMRGFGDRHVGIVLHSFGGFAQGSRPRSRGQDFAVSAAGPLVQIAAGLAVWAWSRSWQPDHWLGMHLMRSFIHVSLFWAALNLLPILPLDGGQLTASLLGPKRRKAALLLSLVCAVGMAGVALDRFGLIAVLFFGMFAFDNWKQLRAGTRAG